MTLTLSLVLAASFAACAGIPADAEADPPGADTADAVPYVYVEAEGAGLRAELAVNGFPVTALDGAATYASAVNSRLVGEGNALAVRLVPATEDSALVEAAGWAGPEVPAGAHLVVAVRRYPADYDGWLGDGELLAEVDLREVVAAERERRQAAFERALALAASDRARAELLADSEAHLAIRFPLEAEAVFDTADLPSFRAELFEREPVEREAVLDYAVRLRDMLRAGDVEGLVREAQPKMDWFNESMPQEYEKDYREMFERVLAFGEVQATFGRSDVVAEPVNGGRLWRLTVPRAPYVDPATERVYPLPSEFVYVQNFETGRSNTFPVTVGLEGGRLRIVF